MASIWDWSTTASNNDDADSTINWLENMVPGDVNNSARAMMAQIAKFRRDLGGTVTATGSANAIAVTANSAFAALADGLIVSFVAANDNTGAATLAANGLTAKSIRIMTTSGDTALSGGEIQAGGVFLCIYNTALNSAAGGWQLINPASAGYQPLDADLTAIAALSASSDDIIQRKAGAWTNRTIAQLLTDLGVATTYAPIASPTFTGVAAFPDGSASAPSITHTGDTNTGLYFGTDIINFSTGGTFAAMFDASRRFVLGSETAFVTELNGTSVTPQFQIQANGVNASMLMARFSNDTTPGRIYFAKSRNTKVGSHTIVQSGDQLGSFAFGGSDGAAIANGAFIAVYVDGSPASNSMPARMTFAVSPSGSESPQEALRIDSTGALIHRNNAQQIVDANSHLQLRSYAKASLPSAATAGQLIYVSDDTGGATPAFSDGTNWRRVADRNVIS